MICPECNTPIDPAGCCACDVTPLCGIACCPNRATRADGDGVGFCDEHHDCALSGETEPISDDNPLDPWWAASSRAAEIGDLRWKDLEYGEWPVDLTATVTRLVAAADRDREEAVKRLAEALSTNPSEVSNG